MPVIELIDKDVGMYHVFIVSMIRLSTYFFVTFPLIFPKKEKKKTITAIQKGTFQILLAGFEVKRSSSIRLHQ